MRRLFAFCFVISFTFCGCGGETDDTGSTFLPPEAAVGEAGGACYGNGTCDEGIECVDELCVDPNADAEEGAEGGVCYGNGTCNEGLDCVDGLCVAPGANPGQGAEGSACYDNGTCNENLKCVEDLCVEDETTVCAPACENRECGDDGCGGLCGECAEGLFCNAGACADTCTSDPECTTEGDAVCNEDASGVRTCAAVAEGCFQLGETTLCEPGELCEAGTCQEAVTGDCVTIKPIATRVAQPTVGSVAVAFSVATCDGEPLLDLGPSSFSIYENGDPVSATESGADILPREAVTYVTLVLDNSPSVKAAGGLEDAVAAAKGFAAALMTDDPLGVRVAVAVFSLAFELRQEHTSDLGDVQTAIDGLLTDETGVNTTNLYGALIDAINHNGAVQDQLFTDMRGGVLTQGQVIMFTDGSDQAAVATLETAQAAVASTNDEVRMVAFGTEVDSEVLQSLASGGAYIGASSAELGELFATVAEQIQAQREALYVLGYCSPKAAGSHELTIEIPGKGTSPPVSFSAVGWLEAIQGGEPSCKAEQFAVACADAECGGLWCGGCVEICSEDLLCGCTDPIFTGAYCDQCSNPKFAPPGCTTCVDPTFTGDTCEECADDTFTGENCDECADPAWTGPDCDLPSPCPEAPDGSWCDDGSACTVNDACDGGACVGTPIGIVCDDGNPCTADACNPATGTCAAVPKAGPCDDGNGCTTGDFCAAGTCTSGVNQCVCESDSDCDWKEDGDLCNGTLVCGTNDGVPACVVDTDSVVSCPETASPCAISLCEPTTGQCEMVVAGDDVPCADGTYCNGIETCQGGECTAGEEVECDDDSPGTSDQCVEGQGCVYTPLNDEPCDDDDLCTEGDTWVQGICTGAPVTCDDTNVCTDDACDAVDGCLYTNNSVPCDDGSVCTLDNLCAAGTCSAGGAISCDDGDPCTDDSCDPVSGCTSTLNANCCIDDSDCTSDADTCCSTSYCGADSTCHEETSDGCCVTDTDCDDGDAGTTDVCEAACQNNGCKNLSAELDKVFVSYDFDDGSLQQMSVFDGDQGDDVGIQTINSTSVSPGYSAYFGDPTCKTYYNGEMVGCEPTTWNAAGSTELQLSLTTEEFNLNDAAGAYLGFWVKMSAEPAVEVDFGTGELTLIDVDYLVVKVDDGSTETTVWKSTDPEALGKENTTNGEWIFQVADLSSWVNKSITVSFLFISDSTGNYNINLDTEPWRGVYLDSIRVQTMGASSYCNAETSDCADDQNDCTSQECSLFSQGGGVCAQQTTTPGQQCTGCITAEDCGSDPCFTYACNAGICNADLKLECCAPSSTFPELTSPPEVSYEGFESGLDQEWLISDPHDDNVSWQVSPILPYEGTGVLYFGDPLTQTYQACPNAPCLPGNPVNPAKATAWTPYFEVGDDLFRKPVAAFWLWMSTEYDAVKSNPAISVNCDELTDRLTIWVEDADGGDPVEGWNSCDAVQNSTQDAANGGWLHEGVDLSSYAGSTVRLGFEFDSHDPPDTAVSNDYGGIRIDQLTVSSVCGTDACVASSDCDDANLCTADLCDLGECTNTQDNPLCCLADDDCDDGNDCTADTCETNLCTSDYKENEVSFCCSEGPWIDAWTEGFEDGLGQFTAASGTGSIVWHASDDASASGDSSANFADPLSGSYHHPNGASVGQLVSSPILVPPFQQGNPYMSFKFLLETEWDDQDPGLFNPLFPSDTLRVYISTESTNYIIQDEQWVSYFITNTTDGLWVNTRVDLDEYRGEEVKVIFDFNSYDTANNYFAGPYIDDVSFATTCKPGSAVQCLNSGDCDPPSDATGFPDECKFASCTEDFKCIAVPVDTPECCEPYPVPDMAEGFEGDGSDWTFESCEQAGFAPFDEGSVWQFADSTKAVNTIAKEGVQMLYFGNGENYGGNGEGEGFGSCGVATGPPITLADDTPWSLEMWLQMDIEPTPDCIPDCNGGGANCFSVDELTIYAVDEDSGIQTPIWTKTDTGCDDYGKWIQPETKGKNGDPAPFPSAIDLSDWEGKTIRLRFAFNTYDYGFAGAENDGKGILIDKLEFIQGCDE